MHTLIYVYTSIYFTIKDFGIFSRVSKNEISNSIHARDSRRVSVRRETIVFTAMLPGLWWTRQVIQIVVANEKGYSYCSSTPTSEQGFNKRNTRQTLIW